MTPKKELAFAGLSGLILFLAQPSCQPPSPNPGVIVPPLVPISSVSTPPPTTSSSILTMTVGAQGGAASGSMRDGSEVTIEIPPGALSSEALVTVTHSEIPGGVPTDAVALLPDRTITVDFSGRTLSLPAVLMMPPGSEQQSPFACVVGYDPAAGKWTVLPQFISENGQSLEVSLVRGGMCALVLAPDAVGMRGKAAQGWRPPSGRYARPDPDPMTFRFGTGGDTFEITNFTDAQHQGGHCWGFSHWSSWYFENHRVEQPLYDAYAGRTDLQKNIVDAVFGLQLTAQQAKNNRVIAIANALLSVPGLAQLQDGNTVAQVVAWTNLTSRPPVLNMFSFDWLGAAFLDVVQDADQFHSVLAYSCGGGIIRIYENNYSISSEITYGLLGIDDYGSYCFFFVEPPDYESQMAQIYAQNPPPGPNQPPLAQGQSVTVQYNTPKAITLTASDPDNGPQALTFSIMSQPSHGSLSGTAPNVTYTPSPGYSGLDSFTFEAYDGQLYSNVATVSISVSPGGGYAWHALGSGMNSSVRALTVFNGELIAAGSFTTAGGVPCNSIARWNGSAWQPLGSGMNDWVFALTVFNGELIAGGYFTTAGGVACDLIARWNGSAWQPMGSGMSGGSYPEVSTLAVFNGELIAGGVFTTAGGVTCNYIARWNGSAWQSLGSGIGAGSAVLALTVFNGELIAGGGFTTAGGVPCNNIARWNSSAWQPLGSGMGGSDSPWVYALTLFNGELIAAGRFWTAGGAMCHLIARWNGSAWQALGSGMDQYGRVYALTVFNGELITGGDFVDAGGITCINIARWNGSAWQPLGSGMDYSVRSLTVYNSEVIAGGWFGTAGGVACNSIASWASVP